MFEMSVEDVFTVTGIGTVFVGRVVAGAISVGDPVVCRTRSAQIPVRVIRVQDASGHTIERGEPGGLIGVVCNDIKLSRLADSFAGEGDNRKVVGVTLAEGEAKKHWWQ